MGAYLGGDEDQAAALYYERVLPYLLLYMDYSEELLKAMLHKRGVLNSPAVIQPAGSPPMSAIERGELEWALERIGLLDTRWPDIGK